MVGGMPFEGWGSPNGVPAVCKDSWLAADRRQEKVRDEVKEEKEVEEEE